MAAAVPAALTALFGMSATAGSAALQGPQNPRAPQAPQAPLPPPFPRPPEDTLPEAPKPDPKQMLKHNREQIAQDVEKLYSLAGELKQQVRNTDSSAVLSLPLVQKAEEIEKLARQIKNLARAS